MLFSCSDASQIPAVIGAHGATIKGLEEKSGAHIWVNQTDRSNPTIEIGGTPAAVRAANSLVTQLLEKLAHPNYEGEMGHKYRLKAERYAEQMHCLFDQAHAAYEKGEGKRAKELSTQVCNCRDDSV